MGGALINIGDRQFHRGQKVAGYYVCELNYDKLYQLRLCLDRCDYYFYLGNRDFAKIFSFRLFP